VSLLEVPGLGPSKARSLYHELRITSIAELERASQDGRLLLVPGFGEKAVENLQRALDRLKERTTRNLISTGWRVAQLVREALAEEAPDALVAPVGSVRRMQETIGNVDLVASGEGLIDRFVTLPNVLDVLSHSDTHARILLYGGVEVRLHCVPRESWGAALVWHTGSRAHVTRLQALAAQRGWRLSALGLEEEATTKRLAGADEAEMYERLGLQWIPPELREDTGEIEAAQAGSLPRLIELTDLKGDLHTHTNWTDGAHSLEDMAQAAKAKGYQYMALTDHSQSLTIARGLTPERLAEERRLVSRLNHKLAPFTILLGTEMDILRDGALDFSDEVLATLDYVSASVHSAFNQPGEVMTARMIRAVSHPLVHTLNHPHGRILRRRSAYAVDMAAVVDAAMRAGCALELNAQPDRLDLDGSEARKARAQGARFTISSDAHSTANLELMQFGVGSARRAWLTATDVLNTRPLDELRALLATPKHR
jgi:DNA polymerase (family 10)